ncbi:MAG: hypothetical protein GX758_02575 [Tenericutes bacterium]|nr:hypothetical protein [Mycoplasmatota bacterium]
MTKIVYPNDGLYSKLKDDLELSLSHIKTAYSIDYIVPGSFSGASYLQKLPSVIEGYYKEMKSISNKVQNTSNKIKNMEDDLLLNVKNTEGIVIKDRDRLII